MTTQISASAASPIPALSATAPASATAPSTSSLPRTYHVRTLGCQMNVHDSEHMAGLLEAAGYRRVEEVPAAAARATEAGDGGADVVIINTCSVRENAATRLFGNLGQLAAVKRERPGMQIAVAGCLAQQMGEGIVEKAPWVDVVFGTHNLDVLPALLERARHNAEAAVELEESLKVFPSTLPTRRESAYAAWVSIAVGCNNTCTFCIVPSLRGKQRDRRPGEVLAEIEAVAAQGVTEVTLLGQNVNSYGVGFGDRGAFAKLLRAAGGVEGIERVRFTSPTPPPSPLTSLTRWPRPRRSCRACTCRCSPARTKCCARCAAPTAPSASCGSWTRCARRSPTPPSPPTSSWASPVRRRRTSRPRWRWWRRRASPRPSLSNTPRVRAPGCRPASGAGRGGQGPL